MRCPSQSTNSTFSTGEKSAKKRLDSGKWIDPLGKSKPYCFSITKELNGHLTVMQNYGRTETRLGESGFLIGENQRCKYFWYSGIISSVKETEIDVVFHDPKGFLKDAVIHYFWFINTVNYGQTPTVRCWIFQCSTTKRITRWKYLWYLRDASRVH